MSDLGFLLLFANPAAIASMAGLGCFAYAIVLFSQVKTDKETKQKGAHIGGGIALIVVAFAILFGAFHMSAVK